MGEILLIIPSDAEGPMTGANGPELGVSRVVILRVERGVGPFVATLLNGGN